MNNLNQYGFNVFSQFGEDGILQHLLEILPDSTRRCVEFGAWDGFDCSNTAHLWHNLGWDALLMETDPTKYENLKANAPDQTILNVHVDPDNIDQLLTDHGFFDADVMSIDVDGDDYFIWESMLARPRILIVEFNPTIPPHISLRGYSRGNSVGQSAKCLVELAPRKSYEFLGVTHCNAFFVRSEDAHHFRGKYELDLMKLMPLENYPFLATDYKARAVLVGKIPAWGIQGVGQPLTESYVGDVVHPIMDFSHTY